MNKLAVDFRADRHLDQVVIHITYDSGSRPQFNALIREHVATDDAVEDNIRYRDAAFNNRIFTDAQRRIAVSVRTDVALNAAVDMTTAFEEQVSIYS